MDRVNSGYSATTADPPLRYARREKGRGVTFRKVSDLDGQSHAPLLCEDSSSRRLTASPVHNDSTLCHLDRSAAFLRFSSPLLEVFSLSYGVHLIYRLEPLHHALLAERAHNRKQTWGHALSRKRNP